jgi:hypothetical protein
LIRPTAVGLLPPHTTRTDPNRLRMIRNRRLSPSCRSAGTVCSPYTLRKYGARWRLLVRVLCGPPPSVAPSSAGSTFALPQVDALAQQQGGRCVASVVEANVGNLSLLQQSAAQQGDASAAIAEFLGEKLEIKVCLTNSDEPC